MAGSVRNAGVACANRVGAMSTETSAKAATSIADHGPRAAMLVDAVGGTCSRRFTVRVVASRGVDGDNGCKGCKEYGNRRDGHLPDSPAWSRSCQIPR